eukprot:6361199-Amphidinium_carterae.1
MVHKSRTAGDLEQARDLSHLLPSNFFLWATYKCNYRMQQATWTNDLPKAQGRTAARECPSSNIFNSRKRGTLEDPQFGTVTTPGIRRLCTRVALRGSSSSTFGCI